MSVERYSQQNRFELIFTTPTGGNYDDNNWDKNGTIAANANLWVLGNYSLYVRPGYTRVNMSMSESKDFFGTAWLSPDGNRLVLVVTNYDKEKGAAINIPETSLPGTPKVIQRFTTTEKRNLEQDYFKVGDPVFVEPHSVSTIIYDF